MAIFDHHYYHQHVWVKVFVDENYYPNHYFSHCDGYHWYHAVDDYHSLQFFDYCHDDLDHHCHNHVACVVDSERKKSMRKIGFSFRKTLIG